MQKQDLKRENKGAIRQGLPLLEPLFEEQDVRNLKPLVRPIKYNQRIEVAPGIQARFVDAGHVIGSSSIELTVQENGRRRWWSSQAILDHAGRPCSMIRFHSKRPTW